LPAAHRLGLVPAGRTAGLVTPALGAWPSPGSTLLAVHGRWSTTRAVGALAEALAASSTAVLRTATSGVSGAAATLTTPPTTLAAGTGASWGPP